MKKVNLLILWVILYMSAFSQFQLKGRFKVDVKGIHDTATCYFFILKKAELTDTNRLIKTLEIRDANNDFYFCFDSLPLGRYKLVIQGFVNALLIDNIFLNNNLDIGCFKSNFMIYNRYTEGDNKGDREMLRVNENGITKEFDITKKQKIIVELQCCMGFRNSIKIKYKHDFIFLDYEKLFRCKENLP